MGYPKTWAWSIVGVILVAGTAAFAQDILPAPPPPPVVSLDTNEIVIAFKNHQWVWLEALAIYGLALLTKQGYLGAWLQGHVPKRAIPFLSPLTGLMLFTTGEILMHKPWQSAMIDGLVAGFAPIIGHEMVIESLFNGKEPLPAKGAVGTTSARDNGPSSSRTIKVASKPPPAAPPGGGGAAAVVLLFLMVLCRCTPQERADAKNAIDFVLSGAQLACVEASALTTSPEVADACKIDLQAGPGVQSFLDNLLSQKAAAQRAGFQWRRPANDNDGGSAYEAPSWRAMPPRAYAMP